MKKTLIILLIVLSVTGLCVSCSTKTDDVLPEKKDGNYKEEIVDETKTGEKTISFLDKTYECYYDRTYIRYENFEAVNILSYDYYKTKDGKYEFLLFKDSDEIHSFINNEGGQNTGRELTKSELSATAQVIVSKVKNKIANYDMGKKGSEYEFTYYMDGYKTLETVTVKLSPYGELIHYADKFGDAFEKFTVSRETYEECENVLKGKIEDRRIEHQNSTSCRTRYFEEDSYMFIQNDSLIMQINGYFYARKEDGGDYDTRGFFQYDLKGTPKNDKSDNFTVFLNETCDNISDKELSKEEISSISSDYLKKIKQNSDKYELTENSLVIINGQKMYFAKYVFKVGEYYTDDVVCILISSEGKVVYAKEENCDKYKNLTLSDESIKKADEYIDYVFDENGVYLIMQAEIVLNGYYKEPKLGESVLTDTQRGLLLSTCVDWGYQKSHHQITQIIEE